jgi:ABC-2 type transport system ATP-binding protein
MAKKGTTVLVTTHYMDEAELCQRVGFISQGRLVALDTPERLKQDQMHGQVLEVSTSQPDRALRVLKNAQAQGKLPLDEVALYGAQIHVVVGDAQEFLPVIRRLLVDEQIDVGSVDWIAPTLEDVFISAIRST